MINRQKTFSINSGSDYPTVEVEVLAVDFSEGRNLFDPESELAGALKDKDIGILVNNVGVITKYAMISSASSSIQGFYCLPP